jgi:ATP-dependent Lon protease
VGREKSVRALEEVMNDEKQILLLTQKNAAEDDPTADGLHTIGTLATVLQLLKLPDQTVRVLVEGKSARPGDRFHPPHRLLPGHCRENSGGTLPAPRNPKR